MKNSLLVFILILLTNGLLAQSQKETEYIKADDLRAWVSHLASDEMRGRANGSDEMAAAANWLADKFEEFGLIPLGPNQGYLQEYSFSRRNSSVSINERNVIGVLPGSDPDLKGEYIIITAHFDHVGVRRSVEGDSIYNGADDNAAGTATLLGVARALKMSGKNPGRSLIFAAVSGEEMGLHGSRYVVNNLPVPFSDIYANINFEMTGHSEELGKGHYYMTGCSYSNLDELVNEFGRDSYITLIDTLAIAERLFFMSDNLSFSRIRQEGEIMYGIPSSTFVTSTFAPHIHSPRDEVELFDLENMADLVNYFSEMVLWFSNCNKPVKWTDERFKRIIE